MMFPTAAQRGLSSVGLESLSACLTEHADDPPLTHPVCLEVSRLGHVCRCRELVHCCEPSPTVDQVMLSAWLVFQLMVCPMTCALSRRLSAEEAADVVDCYTRYLGTTVSTAAADACAANGFPVTAAERVPEDSAVHRIRLIAACLKWDLAHATESGQQPHRSQRRPFCGPYTAAQWDAQRSLVGLLQHLSCSVTLTGTQGAALASIVELMRTHPHSVHELLAVGGLGHVARILVHAPEDRCGRHARLAACQLLHVVAAHWELVSCEKRGRSLLGFTSAAA